MDLAVYDTGGNYFVAELYEGNPVRGVLVDKIGGTLSADAESIDFDAPLRLGSMRFSGLEAARIAVRGKFLAEYRDGKLKRYSSRVDDDEGFWAYAEG